MQERLHQIKDAEPLPQPAKWHLMAAKLLRAVIPLVILAITSMIAWFIYMTPPAPDRAERPRAPRLVEVAQIRQAQTGPVIEAWGEVTAAQTLRLSPEIAGRVIEIHPALQKGGRIPRGDTIVKLDDRDQQLAIIRAQTEIHDIEAQMLLEKGQAAIGERELSRLGRQLTPSQQALVLREPQMAQLQAKLDAARAALRQAQIDQERTTVTAPFDALVITQDVAQGSMLMPSADAAVLVDSARFDVVLQIPASTLAWLPRDRGQTVQIDQPGVWNDRQSRMGHILSLSSRLTDTGRMAELVVGVDNPLDPDGPDHPPLLLGSFVRGTIVTPPIPGAMEIDRAWLRDGDTVWIMDDNDTLSIRPVDVIWRGPNTVMIQSGMTPGERVVTTPLATYAEGMALRTGTTPQGAPKNDDGPGS